MPINGLHTLQPTALLLKHAPRAGATVNTSAFPAEISIIMRQVPQPEHLARNCNRLNQSTYRAHLINTTHNTNIPLGTLEKLRPGTYQLISGDIPCGSWDQLVVSLCDTAGVMPGLLLFNSLYNLSHHAPQENCPAPTPNPPLPDRTPPEPVTPKAKQDKDPALCPLTFEPIFSAAPAEACVQDGEPESALLQPGTPLAENDLAAFTPDGTMPHHKQAAQSDGPTLTSLEIAQLPDHKLWLINYLSLQLVGYVCESANSKKPLFIVHGVPGPNNRQAKPKEPGYDYWIAHSAGNGGFWLRYVSPYDNHIVHPYPVS